MKNLLLILINAVFVTTLLVGCPLYEAAVEDVANNTSTGTSTSSSSSIIVTPSNPTVAKGSTTSFSASGAVTPVTWSVDSSDLGSIDSTSGVCTASSTNVGALTITVTDSNGSVGSTTLTVE